METTEKRTLTHSDLEETFNCDPEWIAFWQKMKSRFSEDERTFLSNVGIQGVYFASCSAIANRLRVADAARELAGWRGLNNLQRRWLAEFTPQMAA